VLLTSALDVAFLQLNCDFESHFYNFTVKLQEKSSSFTIKFEDSSRSRPLDFTQWLQENIDVLNSALDLTLVNVDREQAAGSFSIDLVAEDEGGGMVIIENQLEKSNHDHLGKLITYLTAIGAKAAIWIVSDPRPEHVAAITWLNESGSASFYMVKVEAVRML
jgi:RecB family endonuclease NucS